MMEHKTDSNSGPGQDSDTKILLLEQPADRSAVHELLCRLKNDFEPTFSQAINKAQQTAKASTETNHSAQNEAAPLTCPKLTSESHQPPHLDTLQICQVIKRWCVEHRAELEIIFSTSNNHLQDEAYQDTAAGRTQEEAEGYATLDQRGEDPHLFRLIHQLADRILECRTLIAHSMLSVTPQECIAVTKSVERMLELLNDRQSVTSAIKSSHPMIKRRFRLTDADGKLLIVAELLFAIESTVVHLFQSMGHSGMDLPAPVLCVSSLCALLRNEQCHQAIENVVGSQPRRLTLKVLSLKFEGQTETLAKSSEKTTKPRKLQAKKYSYLDMVYMARNIFNHSSLDQIEDPMVVMWLESSIELIKTFNQSDRFGKQIEHLSKIQTFVSGNDVDNDRSKCVLEVVPEDHNQKRLSISKGDLKHPTAVETTQSASSGLSRLRNQQPSVNLLRIMKKQPSRAFVGRQGVLTKLMAAFWGHNQSEEQQSSLQAARVAILKGHPAIGKSYIALQAVKQLEDSCSPFQIHFWMTASSVELLKSGLVTLINVLGIKSVDDKASLTDLIADVREIFRRFSCLLVLDDVVDTTLSSCRQLVSSLDLRHFVIVTTCVRDLDIGVDATIEDIGPLPVDDCFHLLKHVVVGHGLPMRSTNIAKALRKRLWKDICANRSVVETIVTEGFGQSPLGVALLSQLFVDEMSFSSVVARFYEQDDFSTLTKDSKPLFADQHSGLDITVRYIVARIQHKRQLLELLYVASILSPNGIPLRLLSNYQYQDIDKPFGKTKDSFKREELAELEQTGLLYSESSTSATLRGPRPNLLTDDSCLPPPETVYVFIHQLTQRSLRRVLTREYGILPAQIHRALVRGFWKDMRMDDVAPVTFTQIGVDGLKEASRWSECVLGSVFARQVISGRYLESESHQPEVEEDPQRVGISYDREVMDGLLMGSTALGTMDKLRLDAFLRKLLLQLLRCQPDKLKVSDPGEVIDNFLINPSKTSSYTIIFQLCGPANITVEYLMLAVHQWTRAQENFATHVIDRMRAFHAFLEALKTPIVDSNDKDDELNCSEAVVSDDLANLRALLRCDMAISLLNNFKVDESQKEADLAAKEVLVGAKYYEFARWESMHAKSYCLYYHWKHQEAMETIAPIVEEAKRKQAMVQLKRYLHIYSAALLFLGQYDKVLEIRKDLLALSLEEYPTKYHLAVADNHKRVGEMYSKLGQFDEAEFHFAEYADICKELGETYDFPLVVFHYERGNYTRAMEIADEMFRRKVRQKVAMQKKLDSFTVFMMVMMARGPSFAQTLDQLLSDYEELVAMCLAKDAPTLYKIYVLMMQSRAKAWLGDHRASWKLAQQAAMVDFTYDTITVDHLYINFTIVKATVDAITHDIIEKPSVSQPLDTLLTQKMTPAQEMDQGNKISVLDTEESNKISDLESQSAAKENADVAHGKTETISSAEGKKHETGQGDVEQCRGQEQALDLPSLVPKSLTFCLEHAVRFRKDTDMGWLFEFAQAALQLVNNRELAQCLQVSHQLLDQTRASAIETLQYIISSKSEETEWTKLTRELLA